MSTGNLLGLGLTGLNAAQAGLATTGHNIANVNTPGYSRQQIVQTTRTPMYSGSLFFGTGTSVQTVLRVYSGFLATQAQQSTASAAQSGTLRTQLASLDSLLGDTTAGLSPVLSEFWRGMNGVAANPGDMASRQVVMADATALVSRFHQIAGTLAEQRADANAEISTAVGSINNYTAQIATLNRRIGELAGASGGSQPPNDLLDQRDALIGKLNELIGVSSVVQSDGALDVYLTSGDALVVGTSVTKLAAVDDTADPQDVQLGLATPAGTLRLQSRDFAGGSIGGLLKFRDGALASASNTLGQLATVLASTFNDQHALGIDLGGAAGGEFFGVPQPHSQAAGTNAGTATLAVSLVPGAATALTTSDYRVKYDGANYTVTRLSDNQSWSAGDLSSPPTFDVDGLRIGLAGGTAAAGDSFLVQPTRYAADEIGVALTDPRRIAAGAPVRTALPPVTGSASAANTGTGTISAGGVSAAYLAAPLTAPLTLAYDGATHELTGFPPTQAVTVTLDGASTVYAAGAPVAYQAGATISFGGIAFAINGAPKDGDKFLVMPNTNAVGDNRNATALTALQSRKLVGGAATYGGAFGQLVGSVGAATSEAQVEADAQDSLLTRALTAQQEVSGVNLDEEAANLQRYQQAYQAAAKLMSVASSLFDTILSIGN